MKKCPDCGQPAKRLYGVEVPRVMKGRGIKIKMVMRVMCLRCMLKEVGL